VIAGEMTIEIEGQTNLYQAGDQYVVPDGVTHRASFSQPTVLIDMSDAPNRYSVYR
jgi:quercetin dioxygenase-like cupin family protein